MRLDDLTDLLQFYNYGILDNHIGHEPPDNMTVVMDIDRVLCFAREPRLIEFHQ